QKSNPKQLAKKLTHDIQTLEVFQSHQKDIQIALEPIKGNLSNIEYMLAIVGIFILLVTWINFINLAGAKALGRFKEMGVRKVLGSVKSQIIRQFVFEGLLLNIIGLMCALGIVFLIFPYLRIFTNNRVLPLNEWQTFINPLFLLVFFIGAVITSLYPAIILAGLNPIDALKGKIFQSTHKVGFRKTLVIFQFSISIVLMIGVFIISDQMRFIQNQDLGIDLSRTLIVKTAKDGWNGKVERLKTFKTEVEALSTVEGTASSTMTPGGGNGQDVSVKLEKHNEMLNLHLIGIDANFINQYELEVLAGEPFEKDQFWKNKKGIIINKTAAKKLGYTNFDELISQKIIQSENGGKVYEILAVIDDYHHQSLKEDIPPLIFQFNSLRGHISVKLNAINYQDYEKLVATIKDVEAIWNKTYSDLPFDYYFLDESFNAQYVGDIRFRKIFEVFTTISVFIACLGLFGLSLFVSMKRKKEVGIRKTYGASSVNILGLFTKDYLIQIFVAILIGTPVAYFFMEKWLENYSFKTAIHGTSLFIPIVLLVLISLSCVAFQTVKAAFANPIKTLKNE
ncbi:MAG: FtsX-like permease family protein, partial [Bacteroidota bacterium]